MKPIEELERRRERAVLRELTEGGKLFWIVYVAYVVALLVWTYELLHDAGV